MATDYCKVCKRAVYFLRNNNTGNIAPIDVVPRADGNIVVNFEDESYEVLVGQELEEARRCLAQPAGQFPEVRKTRVELRVSHFMTCPKVEYFRRPKRRKAVA